MSLDRKILDRIKKENLGIRPRWFFVVKDVVLGVGTFFLSILSSLSLALFFEIMKQQDKSLTWLSVPYVWLVLLGVFLLAGYGLVIKIDSLYKFRFVPVMSVLFFVSLPFGYLTFTSGKAEKIESMLEKKQIYDLIMPITEKIPVSAVEKTEPESGNVNVSDENITEDENKRNIFENEDENNKPLMLKNDSEAKIEDDDEDENEEIKTPEKITDTDENEDDSVKGEVKGASKEVANEEEDEEDEENDDEDVEEVDSDDESVSAEDDETEPAEIDAAQED